MSKARRRIDFNVPVGVGTEFVSPGGLIDQLFNNEGILVLTGKGEAPNPYWRDENGEFRKEGITNQELLENEIVARQFAEQQKGFFFKDLKKKTIWEDSLKSLLGLRGDASTEVSVRETGFDNLLGALSVCNQNFPADSYKGYTEHTQIIPRWNRKISQLAALGSMIDQACFYGDPVNKIVLAFRNDQERYQKGIDFAAIRVFHGWENISDSLWMDVRIDINPKRVLPGVDEETVKSYLDKREVQAVLNVSRAFADRTAPTERESVRVAYDPKGGVFVLHRDNYRDDSTLGNKVPEHEFLGSVEGTRAALTGFLTAGYGSYAGSVAQRERFLEREMTKQTRQKTKKVS